MSKIGEASHNAAYARGVRDGKAGEYEPPKGDTLTDVAWSAFNAVMDEPSTQEVAEATQSSYNAGVSAGARMRG